MRTFVGLDCGGSSSRVLAVDASGKAIFEGRGGPANLLATPPAVLERSLREATSGCPPPTAVCGAFAGLVGEDERARALGLLERLFPHAALRAEADYAAAHAAAPAGTDVTIVAGTGSLVCGYDRGGNLVKTGGGGYLLGDEGSGFRYGRAALAAFVHRFEAPSAVLTDEVGAVFGTRDPAAATAVLYATPSPQALLARLFPAFASDLDGGRAYAEEVTEQESRALAAVVARHVDRHLSHRSALRVALTGGVWKATDRLTAALRRALEERLPGRSIEIERTERPPVQGAVELAKEQLIGNGD